MKAITEAGDLTATFVLQGTMDYMARITLP